MIFEVLITFFSIKAVRNGVLSYPSAAVEGQKYLSIPMYLVRALIVHKASDSPPSAEYLLRVMKELDNQATRSTFFQKTAVVKQTENSLKEKDDSPQVRRQASCRNTRKSHE